MTPTTPQLIDTLVACATPVRRLRPPLIRAGLWLLFAAFLLGIIGVVHGLRPDIFQRAAATALCHCPCLARIATAFWRPWPRSGSAFPTARGCGFCCPCPRWCFGYRPIGYGCLTDWVSVSPDGIRLR